MADFWQNLGNWFGGMTGSNQTQLANQQTGAGQQNEATAAGQLTGIGNKSATDFAKESGQAGQALGEQMGQTAATQGTRAATQAARTQGVNKGQSALLGSQQAGNLYTQGQQQGQGMGMNAYGQGANTQLQGAGALGNLGVNQINAANTAQGQATQAGGGLMNAIGGLFSSDENVKEGIKESPDIDAILNKIKPVSFKYKPEAGEGTEEHVGVLAQDLEKTPLKANVVDTPDGKMIDSRMQEGSNLNMILDLARELRQLRSKVGAK